MASEYTSHYNLDLYADTDKPNLRDQYNGAMNKIDQQLYKQGVDTTTANSNANKAVDAANAASKAAADEATRAKEAEAAIKNTADAAGKAASDEATRAKGAESAISDAYKAADTKLSEDITGAYKAADTSLSNTITAAYKAADTKLSEDITAAYKAADSTLAAHFPIKSADIAAGAITRDKLDAQALESIIKGITIRRFDSSDSTADNTGLVVPSTRNRLAGFYVPELTMLVITVFESDYGQAIGSFRDSSATQFKLPSYVPNTTTNILANSIGIVYASGTNFKSWTGIGITRSGFVGVNTPIDSAANTAVEMAGNAVVFLRAFGAA